VRVEPNPLRAIEEELTGPTAGAVAARA
jgi:hypothetical protein